LPKSGSRISGVTETAGDFRHQTKLGGTDGHCKHRKKDAANGKVREKGAIYTKADLHDVPKGEEIHGAARLSALLP
jgi:hypothetical protein